MMNALKRNDRLRIASMLSSLSCAALSQLWAEANDAYWSQVALVVRQIASWALPGTRPPLAPQ